MENPTAPSSERERLECEKLRAEMRKIEAETSEIGKRFWKRAGFWAAATPLLLLILGAAWSWFSGWFDLQQKFRDADNRMLAVQKEELTLGNSKLEDARTSLTNEIKQLRDEVLQEQKSLVSLTNENAKLQADLLKREAVIVSLNNTVSNIIAQSTNEHAVMEVKLRGALLSAQQSAERAEELRWRLLVADEQQLETIHLWDEANKRIFGGTSDAKRSDVYVQNNDSLLTNCGPMVGPIDADIERFNLVPLSLQLTNAGRFTRIIGMALNGVKYKRSSPAWEVRPDPVVTNK
jgi:hypothetical protein